MPLILAVVAAHSHQTSECLRFELSVRLPFKEWENEEFSHLQIAICYGKIKFLHSEDFGIPPFSDKPHVERPLSWGLHHAQVLWAPLEGRCQSCTSLLTWSMLADDNTLTIRLSNADLSNDWHTPEPPFQYVYIYCVYIYIYIYVYILDLLCGRGHS